MSVETTNQSGAGGTFAPNDPIAAYPAEPPVAVRVTMASVLESMHKISSNSTAGLVRLHRMVKHLRRRKPQWNQWSSEPDLYKDQQLIRKFVDELIAQNLVHPAGLDTYRPGPDVSPLVKPERTYTEEDKNLMQTKKFADQPFVCLSCYRNAKCLHFLQGQLTLENLLQMLQTAIEDPEPTKTCKCSVDEKGQKICGGGGTIGTCPEVKKSKNQNARIEQFRLISDWLKLKELYRGKPEWSQCRRAEFGPSGATSVASSFVVSGVQPTTAVPEAAVTQVEFQIAAQRQHERRTQTTSQNVVAQSTTAAVVATEKVGGRRHRLYYVCDECLRAARAKGRTVDGFSWKEIILMICDLLSKEEAEERDVHCVCRKCTDNPDSTVSFCRRAQSEKNRTRSKKVDKNVETIANWVKERDNKRLKSKGGSVDQQQPQKQQTSKKSRRDKKERSTSRRRRSSRKVRQNR